MIGRCNLCVSDQSILTEEDIMPLQLVLGGSGSGKSYHMYQKLIEESKKFANKEYLILVPEQFTMQTQKDVVLMHPDQGIMNIDILSFLRLAYRIFEQEGGENRPILEDLGKSMIVRKVVEAKREELNLFQSNVRKIGFISELKSLLSELLQYSIDSEQLDEMIEIAENRQMLREKLADVKTIYQGFHDYLQEKYITTEEILDVLCEKIEKSKLIKNSVICIDGFTGFTPSQYHLIGKLIQHAKKVYITITMDAREDITRLDGEHKLFYLSKKTIQKLYQIASEVRSDVQDPIWIAKGQVSYRFIDSMPLQVLEQNLFRYPYQVYKNKQSDISIHRCKDSMQEVDFTIQKILSLVREEGYRYRDIAVVTGDIGAYVPIIEKAFTKANLTFFLDYKKDILSNPLVEWLRSLLDLLRRDFDYESMFRHLRCGLVDISPEKVDKIENYVIALGIRGYKKWNQEWTRVYQKDIVIDLEEVNHIRSSIMAPLCGLKDALKGKKTVEEYTKELYFFMTQQTIFEKMEAYRYRFELAHLPLLEKEYKQVYGLVLEIFDRLVELLGTDVITLKEYQELLETGFAEAKVGLIPPGVDQIVIGDIERTRLKDIKALFFIGVNDGVVPKTVQKGGILSDLEREMLNDNKIELAPSTRQKAYIEQFYIYLNLTKPKNRLYLTYAMVDLAGRSKNPSYLIGKIRQIFPHLDVIFEDKMGSQYEFFNLSSKDEVRKKAMELLGPDKGKSYLLEGIRRYPHESMPNAWKELFSLYMSKKDFQRSLTRLVDGAFYINVQNKLSQAVANVLYGKELHNSVTRLEKYASCAFAHFMAYGLELKERKEFRLALPDIGTIFHHAIEIFSRKLQKQGILWHDLTDEIRDHFAEEAIAEATKDYGNTILFSSKRSEYMITRLERMTKRTLWALNEHINQGEFEPVGYEVLFAPTDHLEATNIQISNEEYLRLNGRIDRLDSCESGEESYVKIIDYKSGSTEFDLQKIYYGLQLQLVVYLNASIEIEQKKKPDKRIIPAGIFYYNIDDPVIERPFFGASEEDLKALLLKELKMTGVANMNLDILKKMDQALAEGAGSKSQIIPVDFTSKGEFSARSVVASTDQFQGLSKFVDQKIREYGKEIIEGNVEAKPYLLDQKTPCDYCNYCGICSFDKRLSGNEYRILNKLEKESIWEELCQHEVDKGTTKGD